MRGWADSSSRTLREKTDWFEYITLSRHGPCGPNVEQGRSPLSRNCADKSFVFEGAVSCVFWRWPAGQLWILLGKAGVAAPSSKWHRSFGGAARNVSPAGRNIKTGVVRFFNGRSHPSLSKEGTSAFSSVVFNAPVSSKRCGTWQASVRRGICVDFQFDASIAARISFTRLT